jgi:predicted TIM-barrel fold metal-dependent hydrolase
MTSTGNQAAVEAQGRPNPDPGKPTIFVPPHSCDCHSHVIGPAAQYPFTGERSYTPLEAHRESYVRMLAALGVERAIVVQPSFYGKDNRCTYDAVVASGGRWRGIAALDPDTPRAEVERLNKAGFCGVRLNLIYKGGNSPDEMEALAKLVAPFNWHIQMLMDGQKLPELASRLRKLPIPFVIDHLGRVPPEAGVKDPGFQVLLSLLREGNCWAKLSCPYSKSARLYPYEDLNEMAHALVDAAPDRLVWGSDWPHQRCRGVAPRDSELLDLLAVWVPDAKIRSRILSDNPAKLHGF